jgi:hypothetical protein
LAILAPLPLSRPSLAAIHFDARRLPGKIIFLLLDAA